MGKKGKGGNIERDTNTNRPFREALQKPTSIEGS